MCGTYGRLLLPVLLPQLFEVGRHVRLGQLQRLDDVARLLGVVLRQEGEGAALVAGPEGKVRSQCVRSGQVGQVVAWDALQSGSRDFKYVK